MATPTIENYAKNIWKLSQEDPEGLVPLGTLAHCLGVTAGTITTMLKTLDEAGLVHYLPRQGVRLTDAGRSLALHVLRRHRILELYLVNRLHMDWAEVHDEAEVLEHAVSDKVIAHMEAQLSDTSLDPHGSPIPGSDGRLMDERVLSPLEAAQAGETLVIAKVRDQAPDFLGFLAQHNLKPGTTVSVEAVDTRSGILMLKLASGQIVTLSLTAAEGVEVMTPSSRG